jgi:hypothetical protein
LLQIDCRCQRFDEALNLSIVLRGDEDFSSDASFGCDGFLIKRSDCFTFRGGGHFASMFVTGRHVFAIADFDMAGRILKAIATSQSCCLVTAHWSLSTASGAASVQE